MKTVHDLRGASQDYNEDSNQKLSSHVGTHNLTELRRRLEEKMLLKVNSDHNRDNAKGEQWESFNSTPADTYGAEGVENETGNLASEISQHEDDFSSNENYGGGNHHKRDESDEEDVPVQGFGKLRGNEDMEHLTVPAGDKNPFASGKY